MASSTLMAKYPSMAYLINDPEIGPILEQADREGWPPEKVQSYIEATTWWRTKSDMFRNFLDLEATDPTSLARQVEQRREDIRASSLQLGMSLSFDQLNDLARNSLMFGWSDLELRRHLVYNTGGQIGQLSPVQSRVKELANAYFIPINNESVAWWTRALSAGELTEDNYQSYLQGLAKSAYPHLAREIDSGQTLAQYTQPFTSALANLLEINPSNIDYINNPRWRQILDVADDKGNHRTMTMYEVEQFARNQPEWRYTRNARDNVAQLGDVIAKQMGAVA